MSNATLERQAKANSIDRDLAGIAADGKQKFLVAAVRSARCQSLTQDEVRQACAGAGRSVDDFQRVVKTLRQRIDALDALDKVKAKHDEAAKLADEITKLQKKIEQFDRDYRQQREMYSRQYIETSTAYKIASGEATTMQRQALRVLRETAANRDREPNDLYNVKLD